MAPSDLVTFRGGFTARWPTVQRLMDLEARGARFELLPDDRFRVVPPSVLRADDAVFLRANRDEARQVIVYTECIGTDISGTVQPRGCTCASLPDGGPCLWCDGPDRAEAS